MEQHAPALQLRNVTKYFAKRAAVDDLTMDVYHGEIFGFLGPNGAGKTTTIKTIMGFLREDRGEILIEGINLRRDYESAMSKVGGIVENPDMYNQYTGRRNLRLYANLHGNIPDSRIDEVLKLVGMENRADEKVKRYSLGMKQRLGLALALVHKPTVLILDEPTNGLDPAGIRHLRDILQKMAHEEGIAVLVSSHQLAEMQLMCDRVGIIDKGRLLGINNISDLDPDRTAILDQTAATPSSAETVLAEETGMPVPAQTQRVGYRIETSQPAEARDVLLDFFPDRAEQIKRNGSVIEVDLSESELNQSIVALATQGITIRQLTRHNRSLEDLFLEVTGGDIDIEK